jgi:hypothetical protein
VLQTQSYEASNDDKSSEESECKSWHENTVEDSEAELVQRIKGVSPIKTPAVHEATDGIVEIEEEDLDFDGLHDKFAHIMDKDWTEWPMPIKTPF